MATGANNRHIIPVILLLLLLTSCQAAPPPPPTTASVGDEFILIPNQSATILGTDLTLRLLAVSNDARCPLDIECAESGPVTLTISLQKDGNDPAEFTLQTFTDNDGRAPQGPFEGIQDRMEYEGCIVRVKAVLPYPLIFSDKIKDSEYQVSFVVTLK